MLVISKTLKFERFLKVMFAATLAVVSVLCLGCSARQQTMMNRAYYTEINKAYSIEEVSFLDSMSVLISDRQVTYEGKFLKVSIEFMNAYDNTVKKPVYKIEWLDDKGVMVDSTRWKPLTITGNEKVKVTEMTTNAGATRYKVIISVD
ncbi:MAG: DUF1425 domain-containing protein [Nitrospirae bacterium]|nr:DUF1425 domain-containing protein [Nitrospirota bacterium]